MTAPMIEWTLEVLEWVRAQVWENWPEAKIRGSAPELCPEGYKIRFRDQGKQFWLVLSPQAIWGASVSDVTSLLESRSWIETLREAGKISVNLHEQTPGMPVLLAQEGLGPELHADHHASAAH
ncbi:hypothetical protein ACFL5A_04130 [Gemmatimonadota bacterium]